MICPQCRSADCFRSRRGGISDLVASLTALRPWRCHTCDLRFYARTVALPFVWYAHCPKCGNFDLQHIARERVEKGTLLFLKRMLIFPAYRCDPCREKFFSMLPYRRILPSMVPAQQRHVSDA
jgi:putative component of membrane protein insertase Oxa1/YidC/SpoIIIJ protein YidD